MLNKLLTSFTSIVMLVFLLCGCSCYSSEEIESIKQQAYDEGYNAGYDVGYHQGADDQWELACEELLIDGYSIRNIEEEVLEEFGMTPAEAFIIYDNYTYDWTHGGYTWQEYQTAIEAMYYTSCIFPYDY